MTEITRDIGPQHPIVWLSNGTSAQVRAAKPLKNNEIGFLLRPLGAFSIVNGVHKEDVRPDGLIKWKVSRDWIHQLNIHPSSQKLWCWLDYHYNMPPFTRYMVCPNCRKTDVGIFFDNLKKKQKLIEELELKNHTLEDDLKKLAQTSALSKLTAEFERMLDRKLGGLQQGEEKE